jgi:hypothetical protein
LIIVCGLPGSGKTTLAKVLERRLRAVRFSPDEWMDALSLDVSQIDRSSMRSERVGQVSFALDDKRSDFAGCECEQAAESRTSGHRCNERRFVEFHHVDPHALGGEATVDNIAFACRRHNDYEVRVYFGKRRRDDTGAVREEGTSHRPQPFEQANLFRNRLAGDGSPFTRSMRAEPRR